MNQLSNSSAVQNLFGNDILNELQNAGISCSDYLKLYLAKHKTFEILAKDDWSPY
jgi:hypothetical protein